MSGTERGVEVGKLLKLVGVALVGLVMAACTAQASSVASAGGPATATAQESRGATSSASAKEWETQARRVATALLGMEDALPSIPEPERKADGLSGVLVLGVDTAANTIIVDRCGILSSDVAYRSKAEFVTRVVNHNKEKLILPVDPEAPFVLFYPDGADGEDGDSRPSVAPDDMADMRALSFSEFARYFATQSGRKQMTEVGGWVIVQDGRVKCFMQPIDGTS